MINSEKEILCNNIMFQYLHNRCDMVMNMLLNNDPKHLVAININFDKTSNLQKYFHLNFTLGWCRLPPSPPWLDGLLAVSLISTLVLALLRAILRALPL